MTDQTQRLEIATVRAEIGSNITYRFNNDAIDAGGIPTESGSIKNLKLIIKEIEDKASVSTTIYPTVSTGLAATAEGGMFLVASSEEDEIYVVWRKVGGIAVDTGKRTLSSQAVETATEAAQASADESAASATTAQNAADAAVAQFASLTSKDKDKGAAFVGNAKRVVNATQWGMIEGEDITAKFKLAKAAADLFRFELTMEGLDSGVISDEIYLPDMFNGAGFRFINPTAQIKVEQKKHPRIHSFKCDNLLVGGVWHSLVENIDVYQTFTVTGYSDQWGTFWNTFRNIRAGRTIIDVRQQAVNQNVFDTLMGNTAGQWGVLITDFGATSSTGIMECHNNKFINGDTSHSFGMLNTIADRNQINQVIGGYCEHGANIYGNFMIGGAGAMIDGLSPPLVSPRCHVLFSPDHSPATAGEYLSSTNANICRGGDWSVIDSSGKPPGFSASFAASTVNVFTTGGSTSTPYGSLMAYGGVATGAGHTLNIKVKASSGYISCSVVLWCPNGQFPKNLLIDDGVNPASYRDASLRVSLGGGFHMWRVSGVVAKTATATIQFVVTDATQTSAQIYIGAVDSSPYKVSKMPYMDETYSSETVVSGGMETRRGVKSIGYSTGSSLDLVVTYATQLPAGVSASVTHDIQPASTYEGKFLKSHLLGAPTATGFTVRVYFTTDFTGSLHWQSMTY